MPKARRDLKPIRPARIAPVFKSEAAEREFWETADSTEYVDWGAATVARFPNLRPSSTAISVRLPDTLLTELKLLANERDVPYQSLLKVYLTDRVKAERRRQHHRADV
jgi:predicted DNA binding CopG/RHH family protein